MLWYSSVRPFTLSCHFFLHVLVLALIGCIKRYRVASSCMTEVHLDIKKGWCFVCISVYFKHILFTQMRKKDKTHAKQIYEVFSYVE